ncbi:DUF4179 domain-containing protein [Cytobacillus solani]|uniref:DUF4179 domain-containing protein n=1 Tax=Cytobacillus solani TaxID=1637975 RepID=UPI0020797803|nr:DUF4179 domain-containing protein [Cytobacillus solani]USK54438.1 DUF4179 domain-containing protein [Cytobacillus solani]
MFEKEEKNLSELKKMYEDLPFPEDKIDEAILSGFKKAKEKPEVINKPRQKKWLLSGLIAAVFIIGFLTSIRVSPVFASYVSSIPGMEKLVELISDNKGLMLAVENEYVQEINTAQEKNGLKVTFDSVIADEKGMVIFQTIEAKKKQEKFYVNDLKLESADGTELQLGSYSYGAHKPQGELRTTEMATMDFFFEEPLKTKEFTLTFTVETNDYEEDFQFQFTLEKPLKATKSIEMNKTILIEGQKITIKNIKIYPLRVAVHVVMDPENSKRIFTFEDIRLVDENGEAWTKIANGFTASQLNDNEHILYLQSNYFKEPKELYLVMNKLQAVDQEDAYVKVDIDNEKIINQPKGNMLTNLKVENGRISFILNTEKEFNHSLFVSMREADGKEIDSSSFYWTGDNNGKREIGVEFPPGSYKNPLELKLSAFPAWIEGDVKIKVK